MNVVLIASSDADLRARAALDRALRLQPARTVRAAIADRWASAREVAGDTGVEWIGFIDDDVLLAPDAFGALNRTFATRPAVVGGRALVAGEQRFGAMFGPARWGPDPTELSPISAPESLRTLGDAMRGPMDVPARGLLFVAAAFARECETVEPWALNVALGLRARDAGQTVWCEPRMTFSTAPDPPEVLRRVPRLLREAGTAWGAGELHRDPPGPRERLIGREVRTAGNIRGYERRPYPAVSLLIVGSATAKAAAALRATCGVADVVTCAAGDGASLRRRLAQTGERYLLVVEQGHAFTRQDFVELVERVERSGRYAVALGSTAASFGAALFHLGRIVGVEAYTGTTVADVVAEAVRHLPERRLFAVGPAGPVVPQRLPEIEIPRTLTFVVLACSRPGVTRQTMDALSQTIGTSPTVAIIARGATTTRKLLGAWPETAIVEDEVDPNLGAGLNRVLAGLETDAVFVLRDDVQIARVTVPRLLAAFARIPGLGAAVPRVNGAGLPEALSDIEYRDLSDMEAFVNRRAVQYAREAPLVPFAATPALMISRRALERIGGFDPRFGFTRFGIVDFTRRLALANVPVARCDDGFGHLFTSAASGSLLAAADESSALGSLFERQWKDRTAFEPARDRVVLRAESAPAVVRAPALTVLVPVADDAEWEDVRAAVGALVVSFTIDDPVEIAIGLDGAFDVAHAVQVIRELLAGASVPLERTVNVRIEPVADVTAWREQTVRPVRLRETAREALASLPLADGVLGVRALFDVEHR